MTTPAGEAAAARPAQPEQRRMQLQRAALRGDRLAFTAPGGFAAALRDGCFLLAIPRDLDVAPGVAFSRQFYRAVDDGDPQTRGYRGFRDRADVYFDREHFQTEHVLIDGPGRRAVFPPALIAMCDRMNELALIVLRQLLAEVGVPPALWAEVTGGAVENLGTHWFASSHYRPERALLGCAPHKDTGFVTVLYIDQDGLEASCEGGWVSIDAVPGHLVVNFGGSLEILTQHTRTPVRAILHRVRQTTRVPGVEDRFSFAAFANPPASGMLYCCDADGRAWPYRRVDEFLVEFNQATWHDRHDEFGVK